MMNNGTGRVDVRLVVYLVIWVKKYIRAYYVKVLSQGSNTIEVITRIS